MRSGSGCQGNYGSAQSCIRSGEIGYRVGRREIGCTTAVPREVAEYSRQAELTVQPISNFFGEAGRLQPGRLTGESAGG